MPSLTDMPRIWLKREIAQAAVIIPVTVILTFALYEIIKRIPPLRYLLGIKKHQTVK
jgi:hypothetical protein